MTRDFCTEVRDKIGDKLAKLGFEEAGCHYPSDEELKGHGGMYADQLAYYRGDGRLIVLSWSIGNGHGCNVARADADPATFQEWPTLWSLLAMDSGLRPGPAGQIDPDRLGAYLEQFPKGYDEMLNFIAAKLAELVA